jgi:hypothetical protein
MVLFQLRTKAKSWVQDRVMAILFSRNQGRERRRGGEEEKRRKRETDRQRRLWRRRNPTIHQLVAHSNVLTMFEIEQYHK